MQSAFQFLGIPDGLIVLVFTISLTLILACVLPGQEIGPIKIPAIERGKRLISLILGLFLFAASVGASMPLLNTEPNPATATSPHAPPISINSRYTLWGEETMQFSLAPGESRVIKARDLYSHAATFPRSSCAGPGIVPYTWRVRDPYPRGGEVEIRAALMGGTTQEVGRGSFGDLTMGYCDEHTLKNVDAANILVEIRYASAADLARQ